MRLLKSIMCTLVCSLVFSVFGLVKSEAQKELIWSESLEMVELPAFGGWELIKSREPNFALTLYKGILTVDTTSEDETWCYGKETNLSSSIGYTIEARLKVDPKTPHESGEGICVNFEDGVHDERLFFETNRVGFYHSSDKHTYRMDTTDDFHTYRITVQGDSVKLYVDGEVAIKDRLLRFETAKNRILFGDIDNNAGVKGKAYWDYIRFYTNGAISEDILYTADYLQYIKDKE